MEFPRHEELMKKLAEISQEQRKADYTDLTKNVYTDIEAIESRLDDRIDGIEKRSDEAIKSLAKVLAEELGSFCRREIAQRLNSHAADWQEAMDEYDVALHNLAQRLDSARERGTGGVQDCMKLLQEETAERKRATASLVKNDDLTDESVEALDSLCAELKRRVEKLEQGKIDSVSPALRGSIPARLGKPRRLYAAEATYATDESQMRHDAGVLGAIAEGSSNLSDAKRKQVREIVGRLLGAADNLRS